MELTSEYNDEPVFGAEESANFLRSVKAEEREWNRWAGPKIMESLEADLEGPDENTPDPHRIFGIPKLDFLLDSRNEENVLQGLTYLQDLNLMGYSDRVLEHWSSGYDRIRKKALSIIIEWNLKEAGGVLAEALQDLTGWRFLKPSPLTIHPVPCVEELL